MPILLVCGGCHSKLNAIEKSIGKQVKCPKCGLVNSVAPTTPTPAIEDATTCPPSDGVHQTLNTFHAISSDPQTKAVPTQEHPTDPQSTRLTLGAVTMNSAASPVPTVPGYEILSELGRGGMGVVYKARQINANRQVALKMILTGGHAGSEGIARFQTEAHAIAALQHPNIVQVFDVGVQDGLPFFSLEFCSGGSLDRKLGGTPLPPQEAARLVETLARAIHVAHQANVIHRDLKPANVLLLEDDTPKITDFGLAKKLDDVSGLTQSGAIMGTPSYMAPEQATGNSKEVGPATDIYALGALLYECLTGRPPFKAATVYDTLAQVSSEEPVTPSRLAAVPRDLETICLKCLHKAPGRRYSTARELADDLGRFLDGEPVQARPVGQIERVLKWTWRRPTTAALLVVSVLALASLGIGGWVSRTLVLTALSEKEEQRKAAELAETDAKRNAKTAQEKSEALAVSEKKARENEELAVSNADRAEKNAKKASENADRASKNAVEATQQRDAAELAAYQSSIRVVLSECEIGNLEAAREMLDRAGPSHFRGWEWYHLRERIDDVAGRVRTDAIWAKSLVFTRDRKVVGGGPTKLFVASRDQPLDKSLTLELNGKPASQIEAVVVDPDGKWLAAGGKEGLNLWSLPDGKWLRKQGAAVDVATLAISADGKYLASGGKAGIDLWEMPEGKTLGTLEGHKGKVVALTWHPSQSVLASVGEDKTVRRWDVEKRVETHNWTGESSVAFSPDGSLLAHAKGRMVWLRDAKGEVVQAFEHPQPVVAILFLPLLGEVAALGQSLTGKPEVRVWDSRRGTVRKRIFAPRKASTLALTPDGLYLAASGFGNDVELHTTIHPAGRFEWLFAGKQSFLAFSRDSRHTVFPSQEGIFLSGKKVKFDQTVQFAAFRPDGRELALLCADHTLRLCDSGSGAERNRFEVSAGLEKLTYRPDGKAVALWGQDAKTNRSKAQILSLPDGKPLAQFTGQILTHLAFSPDGKEIVASGTGEDLLNPDVVVWVYDASTGKQVRGLKGAALMSYAAEYSPDGRFIAVPGVDKGGGYVLLHDARTGAILKRLHCSAQVQAVAFHSNGKRIAGACRGGAVKIWSLPDGAEIFSLQANVSFPTGLRFSSDGTRLGVNGENGLFLIWNARSPAKDLLVSRREGGKIAITCAPDGNEAAAVEGGGLTRVGRDQTGLLGTNKLEDIHFPSEALLSLAYSPNGKWLAAADYAGKLHLVDRQARKRIHILEGHTGPIHAVAFDADDRLYSAGHDGTLRLWDPVAGKQTALLGRGKSPLVSLCTIPGTDRIATGDLDGLVSVWNRAGKKLGENQTHTGPAWALASSPDGKWLVSGGDDGTVAINAADGTGTPRTLRAHRRPVRVVVFIHGGKRFVSGGEDGILCVYKTDPAEAEQQVQNDSAIQSGAWNARDELLYIQVPHGSRIAEVIQLKEQ